MGIETTFVPADDLDAVRAAIRPNTRMVLVETIANPSGEIADVAALARVAHEAGVALAVDNTFASPYLFRPIEHGADLVLHSATKFISGHGTTIGGVLVESGTFPWANGRFPLLSAPSPGYHGKIFAETFGEYAFLLRARAEVLRDVGAQMAPMDAGSCCSDSRRSPLRMERHVANARAIAAHLKTRREVAWVREPEMGSIFTFGLRGGRDAGRRFIDALELVESSGQRRRREKPRHPSRVDHALAALRRRTRKAGVPPELVRLSVGLEDVDDLIWDSTARSPPPRLRRRHARDRAHAVAAAGAARKRQDDRGRGRVAQRAAPELHGFLVSAHANAVRRDADQSGDRSDRRRQGVSVARRLCGRTRRTRSRRRLS